MARETKSVHKVVRTEGKKDIVHMRGMFFTVRLCRFNYFPAFIMGFVCYNAS